MFRSFNMLLSPLATKDMNENLIHAMVWIGDSCPIFSPIALESHVLYKFCSTEGNIRVNHIHFICIS